MRQTGRTTRALSALLARCIAEDKRGVYLVNSKGMEGHCGYLARGMGLSTKTSKDGLEVWHFTRPENSVTVSVMSAKLTGRSYSLIIIDEDHFLEESNVQ